jgi:hypothetical protein
MMPLARVSSTRNTRSDLLEAIHEIVEAVHVLKPIRFQSIRRNEVAHKMSVGAMRRAAKWRNGRGPCRL